MELEQLKEKTKRNIVNAKHRVNIFLDNALVELAVNQRGLNQAQEDLDYYESINKILNTIPSKLERWLELLESDGINSKNMVATDIQQLLEEIDK